MTRGVLMCHMCQSIRMRERSWRECIAVGFGMVLLGASLAGAQETVEYKRLPAMKTSTMQAEMQKAAEASFRFADDGDASPSHII
jgi:hypothetical protein